jgi:hypothetical protein
MKDDKKDDECDYRWPSEGDYYYIFKSAHEGNYDPLIRLIENAATLDLPDLRGLLVKILSGQMPRHGHRQKDTLKGSRRNSAITRRVNALAREGWKEMAAIAKAAEEFDCSLSKVKSVMRASRKVTLSEQMRPADPLTVTSKGMKRMRELYNVVAQDNVRYELTYDRSKKDEDE